MSDLAKFREQINNIDSQITNLLAERVKLSLQIAEVKQQLNVPVRDIQREKELLEVIGRHGEEKGLDSSFLEKLFGLVLEESRRVQQKLLSL